MKKRIVVRAAVLAALALVAVLTSVWAGLFEWSRLGRLMAGSDDDPYVSIILPDPTGEVIYAGARLTVDGAALVYRSDDDGATWAAAAEGLPDDLPPFAGVNDLLLLPGDPPALLAGLSGRGVWRSDDGGATWSDYSDGGIRHSDTVLTLLATSGPAPALFALTTDGIHRRTDRWIHAADGLPAPGDVVYNDLALDPTQPAVLYAATNPLGLFRSDDGGRSWQPANGDLPGMGPGGDIRNAREVAVSPHTGEVFVGLRGAGLYRSGNGGATWTPSQVGITYVTTLFGAIGAPVFDPHDAAVAYVFNSDGIFRSGDGGRTWTRVAAGLPAAVTTTALVFAAARDHTVYAGTSIYGVWEWTQPNGGRAYVPVIRR